MSYRHAFKVIPLRLTIQNVTKGQICLVNKLAENSTKTGERGSSTKETITLK